MKITAANIDSLREALAALPPPPKVSNATTKRGAIAALARNCSSSAARRYGLESLSVFLKEKGLAISSGTLKNYLQRSGATRTKRRKRKIVALQLGNSESGTARLPAPPTTARPVPSVAASAASGMRLPGPGR